MEPTHVYVKARAEFGRQCFFDSYGPVIDEDIQPDHLAYQDYIRRNPCHVASQKPKQYAVHEVQASANPLKSTGMFHFEGGWPRDINPQDEEATARFRRRTEKEDDWAPKLRHLFRVIEFS
ncbi:dynein intermediate chain 3, ciliary-like [Cephus cinctus]|uniref:Dynein intermediate chain 3, ciliary-like n=1 Tax=Cephus cinctus TaxID=211228 RepID=A0AAJ7W123_CEPCN|nr:dynein intermediate chain 3, ciliary-like [Cephus cinctus]